MCLVGQSLVFSEASELLLKTLQIDVSGTQIHRVCNYYGHLVNDLIEKDLKEYIPKLSELDKSDNVYVMIDGSMLYTRDEDWKEIKLGRIFKDSKVIPISPKRTEVFESVYVSHMGSVNDFFPKLERHLIDCPNKVIIGDGAKWIWNWVESNYPGSTQILDFYHAKEKLVLFSNYQFKDDDKRSEWLNTQVQKLKDEKIEDVINTLKKLRSRNTKAKEYKDKAINYYLEHEDRMLYKTYRDKGLMIGSGPIEAAHRSVLQQRMKLSGQKWTRSGVNSIANLRCYKKSDAWDIIESIIKAA